MTRAPQPGTPAEHDEGGYEPFIAAEGWREDASVRYVPESEVTKARAEEREACAQIAEQEAKRFDTGAVVGCYSASQVLKHIADLIRARTTP